MLRAERKRARERLAAREAQGSDVHGHSLKKKDQKIKNKNDGWAQPEKNKIKHINNKKRWAHTASLLATDLGCRRSKWHYDHEIGFLHKQCWWPGSL